jgi:hypothetical protein
MAAGVGEHDQRVGTGQGGGIAQFGLAGFLPCRRVPDLARELTAAGRIACLDGSDSNGEGFGSVGIVCAGEDSSFISSVGRCAGEQDNECRPELKAACICPRVIAGRGRR